MYHLPSSIVLQQASAIAHNCLETRWGIHPALAKETVELTMQQGVQISCPRPSLTKCIQTNDSMFWYNQLPCNVFADTLISGTVSKRGNKYAVPEINVSAKRCKSIDFTETYYRLFGYTLSTMGGGMRFGPPVAYCVRPFPLQLQGVFPILSQGNYEL